MKKCPYCAEEIQDDAIVCKFCNSDLNLHPPKVEKKKSRPIIWFIIGLIIFCFITTTIILLNYDPDRYYAQISPNLPAWKACENFISDSLYSPSSAEFENFSDEKVVKLSDGSFKMNILVKAKNSSGVMVEGNFYCQVYKNSNGWQLVDLH